MPSRLPLLSTSNAKLFCGTHGREHAVSRRCSSPTILSSLFLTRPHPRRLLSSSTTISSNSSGGSAFSPSSKIQALPFRVPTSRARTYLASIVFHRILWDRNGPFFGIFLSLFWRWLYNLGIPVQEWMGLGPEVRCEKIRAVYLPVWVVDACVEMESKGSSGKATSTFITMNSGFPGSSWPEMKTLYLKPPSPEFEADGLLGKMLRASGEESQRTIRRVFAENVHRIPSMTNSEYKPWDPTEHLSPEVDIEGGEPLVLPFSISPLCLPDLLRKGTLEPTLPGESSDGVDAEIVVPIKVNELVRIGSFMLFPKSDKGRNGSSARKERVVFDGAKAKIDLLASYPVYMPIHLSQFSYIEKGKKKFMNLALGAWDTTLRQAIAQPPGSTDWRPSPSTLYPLSLTSINYDPRPSFKVPISSEDGDTTFGGSGGSSRNCSSSKGAGEQIRRSGDEHPQDLWANEVLTMEAEIATMAAAQYFVYSQYSELDLSSVEAWHLRHSSPSSISSGSSSTTSSTPTTDPGSKSSGPINWQDPSIQPLTTHAVKNRRYLAALHAYLRKRQAWNAALSRPSSRSGGDGAGAVEKGEKKNSDGARRDGAETVTDPEGEVRQKIGTFKAMAEKEMKEAEIEMNRLKRELRE